MREHPRGEQLLLQLALPLAEPQRLRLGVHTVGGLPVELVELRGPGTEPRSALPHKSQGAATQNRFADHAPGPPGS